MAINPQCVLVGPGDDEGVCFGVGMQDERGKTRTRRGREDAFLVNIKLLSANDNEPRQNEGKDARHCTTEPSLMWNGTKEHLSRRRTFCWAGLA